MGYGHLFGQIFFLFFLPVWADSENGVNFSKVKILRKRSTAHAQLIKIPYFYVKTRHSGELIVQCGLFICRSEKTFKCFIRHVVTECIWQKYIRLANQSWSILLTMSIKVNKLLFFYDFTMIKDYLCARV